MEWYIPLTVLPAIALIILSTSNFLMALNIEIDQLEKSKDASEWVIGQKLKQLKRLGFANILLYSSVLFFLFSALTTAISHKVILLTCLMIIAVFLFTLALIFLLVHSVKAIKIRQKHLNM